MRPLQERDTNANTAKPDKANESNDKKSNAKNASKAKEPSKDAPTAADLSDIHLDGEIDENVKIYDTCDDIRKKINGHLKNTTQAAFARELSDLLPHSKINASHVGRYLKMKGPKAGGHNPVFYAAYVYFEKLRIKQGKKKSAKREKMEDNWDKKGGFPREGSHNIYVTCLPGERWTFDQYGVPKQTASAVSQVSATASCKSTIQCNQATSRGTGVYAMASEQLAPLTSFTANPLAAGSLADSPNPPGSEDSMAANADEEPSYIDYETFLDPGFTPASFANALVLATNNANDATLDLSTPLSKVLFDAQEIDSHIDLLTTRSAIPLLSHTKDQTESSTRIISEIDSQVKSLNESYKQLEKEVIQKHAEADEVKQVASRLWETLKLGRSVGRCLQLGRQLEVQHSEISSSGSAGKKEDHRALVRCAHTILSLREVLDHKAPGEEGYGLDRINAVKSLQDSIVAPVERSVRSTSEQIIREFAIGSASGTATFAQSEETKARTLSAMTTLYLLSPTSGVKADKWTPQLLLQALEVYFRNALQSSVASLARSLATLPTLDRTLAEVAARCQNIVALEIILDTTKAPTHPLLSKQKQSAETPNLLQPLLAYLETGSLPSYFWRSMASSLSTRVVEIVNRGGVSARTLKSNRSAVGDAMRECVIKGSQPPSTVTAAKGKSTKSDPEKAGWEREVAVMVGSVKKTRRISRRLELKTQHEQQRSPPSHSPRAVAHCFGAAHSWDCPETNKQCGACPSGGHCAECREVNISKLNKQWKLFQRSDQSDKDMFDKLFALRYGSEAMDSPLYHKFSASFDHSIKWHRESLGRFMDAISEGRIEGMSLSSAFVPNDGLAQLSTDDLLERCSELTQHLQKLHAELIRRKHHEPLDSDTESVYSDVEFEEHCESSSEDTVAISTQLTSPPTSQPQSNQPEGQKVRSRILKHWSSDDPRAAKFVRMAHSPRFLAILLDLARHYSWEQTTGMVNYAIIERVAGLDLRCASRGKPRKFRFETGLSPPRGLIGAMGVRRFASLKRMCHPGTCGGRSSWRLEASALQVRMSIPTAPLAALTTVFTPPCATSWLLTTTKVPSQYPPFPTTGPSLCDPPSWESNIEAQGFQYYSPAVCPSGFEVGPNCEITKTRILQGFPPVADGETAVYCVPSGHTCTTDTTDFRGGVWGFTRAAATPTSGVAVVTVGPALQIRFRDEDLSILETHPLTPGLVLAGATTSTVSSEISPASTAIVGFSTITGQSITTTTGNTILADSRTSNGDGDDTPSILVVASTDATGSQSGTVTTDTTEANIAASSSSSSSMNPGSLAAIVLSSILIVIVLAITSVIFIRRNRRSGQNRSARLLPFRQKPWRFREEGYDGGPRARGLSVASIVLPIQTAELSGTAPSVSIRAEKLRQRTIDVLELDVKGVKAMEGKRSLMENKIISGPLLFQMDTFGGINANDIIWTVFGRLGELCKREVARRTRRSCGARGQASAGDIFNTPCATFAHIGLPGRCDATLPSITTIMPNELEPAPSVSYYNNGLSHERITSGAVINTADGRNIHLDVESYGHGTFWRRVTQKLRGLVSGEHKKDG
ncbi:putative Conserved oligomeric Golgi complex subunit 5 [Seiridium cardinale]|uniref:Conserved oligomeric Golgi complex subunit 5 n=1 Tax=Seiridium cardinale TaxID=138064 RepID=A0ABR2XCW9_9PEZI